MIGGLAACRKAELNRGVTAVAAAPDRRPARQLLIPLVAGLLVAETLGIIARELVVAPGAYPGPWFRLFFSDTLHLKAWLALAAAVLGVTQLFTAAWIFRKLPWPRPRGINVVHRWSGRIAFLLTIPVAYHCVFKLGFQTYSTRVVEHSFFGVAFYGAFVTKVLVVRMHRFPGWALPLAGGLLFVALIGAWWTSSFWFLRQVGGGT
jgi:Family of unknown function (DUF6529)